MENKNKKNEKECNNSKLEDKDVTSNIKDNLDTIEKELDEISKSLDDESTSIEDTTVKLEKIDKHINMFEKALETLKFKNEKVKKDKDEKTQVPNEDIQKNISKNRKFIIIGSIFAFLLCFVLLFNNNKKEKEIYPFDIVKEAISLTESLDGNKINKYFKDFDENWLKELDFTSNLASSEELKEATNLDKLQETKSDLFRTLTPKNIKEVITTEDNEQIIVSISFDTVNTEEFTKNIVSGLLTASIENSKDGLTVNNIVDGYIESFKNVAKSNYTTTESNASIELEKTKDGYIIKDFRKFINSIIPNGNFYKEYMDTVRQQVEPTSVTEEKDSKTVIDSVKEAEKE